MLGVPVSGAAVVGAVLAHRRHDDAVLERSPRSAMGEKSMLVMAPSFL